MNKELTESVKICLSTVLCIQILKRMESEPEKESRSLCSNRWTIKLSVLHSYHDMP
jgi:hypothetical protein